MAHDGTNNKVSDIIIRLLENRKLLLICILLLLHSLMFLFRFHFYKNMVVVYVFLLEEAMYCYCYLCILIVSVCIIIVVYIFLDAATLTEVFPCFFLSCKANARVNLAKTGHGPHSPKLLCCSMYCLFCVVLCTVCV